MLLFVCWKSVDLLLFVNQIAFTSVPGKFCITLDTSVTSWSANLFITYHFKGQNPYDDDSNSPEGTLLHRNHLWCWLTLLVAKAIVKFGHRLSCVCWSRMTWHKPAVTFFKREINNFVWKNSYGIEYLVLCLKDKSCIVSTSCILLSHKVSSYFFLATWFN